MLQNIVALSEIRVDELMRPRNSCRTFRPPVALADLKGQMPPSGYMLVTEPDSEEIAKAINIPVGTAKTRMRLALQKLRAALVPESAD